MANEVDNTMVSVPLGIFVQGQVALEKIDAIEEYAVNAKYIDTEVVFGILGVRHKGSENE